MSDGYESQKRTILKHLKESKSITSWEAITQYRITRLSAVIYLLRDEGYDVITTRHKGVTEEGVHKNWAIYHYLGRKA
tara:strand:+ start:132 stop:365 length:234 start_codon:yes stop_codon:yes gene_type:complete